LVHQQQPDSLRLLETEDSQQEWEEIRGTTTSSSTAVLRPTEHHAGILSSGNHVGELRSSIEEIKISTDDTDIAEKLRVEETKAALAAARIGMEQQAAKLQSEKQQQKQQQQQGAIAPASGSSTGKWLPPQLRAGGGGAGAMMSSSNKFPSSKLDVENQESFPDLASAGKILETQQKSKKPPKKVAPGSATWGDKPKMIPGEKQEPPPAAAAAAAVVSEEPKTITAAKEEESEPSATTSTTTPTPTEPVATATTNESPVPTTTTTTTTEPTSSSAETVDAHPKIVPKKKKKKDLSTFKTSS
jgi:hypothetical protein